MKANELMIGDWVYNEHHQKNIQITAYDFFTHGHDKNGEQYLFQNCKPTRFGDIKPIFITDDILNKNEFTPNHIVREWRNLEYDLCLDEKDDMFFIFGRIGIKYVHELQHVLRTCGLSYLADNFKL